MKGKNSMVVFMFKSIIYLKHSNTFNCYTTHPFKKGTLCLNHYLRDRNKLRCNTDINNRLFILLDNTT